MFEQCSRDPKHLQKRFFLIVGKRAEYIPNTQRILICRLVMFCHILLFISDIASEVLLCARVTNQMTSCSVGIQQSGSVSWAAGGEGRARGEEERESAHCRLAQLDSRLHRNVRYTRKRNQIQRKMLALLYSMLGTQYNRL